MEGMAGFGSVLGGIGSIAGGAGGLFGSSQKHLMKHKIRWAVADAQKAGLSPYAALGAQVPTGSSDLNPSAAGAGLGDGMRQIGSAFGSSKASPEQKQASDDAHRLAQAQIDNLNAEKFQRIASLTPKMTQLQAPNMQAATLNQKRQGMHTGNDIHQMARDAKDLTTLDEFGNPITAGQGRNLSTALTQGLGWAGGAAALGGLGYAARGIGRRMSKVDWRGMYDKTPRLGYEPAASGVAQDASGVSHIVRNVSGGYSGRAGSAGTMGLVRLLGILAPFLSLSGDTQQ